MTLRHLKSDSFPNTFVNNLQDTGWDVTGIEDFRIVLRKLYFTNIILSIHLIKFLNGVAKSKTLKLIFFAILSEIRN